MTNEVSIRVTMNDDTKTARDALRAGFATSGTEAGRDFGEKARESVGRQVPAKMPVEAKDPIDEAWRAQVQASIRSIARDAIKIPMSPDTAKYREELQLAVGELSSAVKAKIPVDMDGADQFKLHVEELAREVSAEVKAKIPVEADEGEASKAADKVSAAANTRLRENGAQTSFSLWSLLVPAAPMIGAAAGAALVGGFGIGVAALGVTMAAQTDKVKAQAAAFGTDLKTSAQSWGLELQQPVTQGLATIEAGFDQLKPAIGRTLGNTAPDIRILANSVTDLATGAMPGLEAASGRLIPVFNGVDAAAKQIGTSTGQTMDIVSQHSVQIGTAIDQVGQIIGSVERTAAPLIGDLADAFAHTGGTLVSTLNTVGSTIDGVAHTAAPALAGGIQADLTVIQGLVGALGPASSLLGVFGGTALTAYMNVSLLGKLEGPINSAVTALDKAGTKGTVFGDTTSKISAGLGKVGDALPYVGVGLALIGTAMDLDSQHANDLADASDKWAAGLEAGGAQAVQVRSQMDAARKANDTYLKSMADLEATQKDGTQTAGQYGDMAGSNARQIAELSQNVQDNKTKADQALQKYNEWTAKMGLSAITADQLAGKVQILSSSSQSASSNTSQLKADLDILNTAASTADQKIKALSDSLAIMGDHGLQKAQDYAAQFGNALDGFGQQIDTAKGKIFGLNGELDTNSAKGRDVLQLLEQSQQSWSGQAQAMADAGQSTGQINSALQTNRDRLAGVLEQAGLTQGQVQSLLDTYGLIPANISTRVDADTSPAVSAVENLVRYINGQRAVVTVDTATGATTSVNFGGGRKMMAAGGIMGAASGRILGGDDLTLVGESGPELIRGAVGSTVIPYSGVGKTLEHAMSGYTGQAGPIQVEVRFTGNTDTAFATAFMNLMRQGQIQILSQYIQK